MSQKYKLVQDQEDDSRSASIQRHLGVAAWVVIVPVVALMILSAFYSISAAGSRAARDTELRYAIQTQQAITPRPTHTPRPTNTRPTPPSIRNQTLLRVGAGEQFDSIGSMDKGEQVIVVGRDKTGKWYMLHNSFWIEAKAVIGAIADLPIVG